MGLFGGFKAKFRGNSETKHKPERVVVLRYQVHSEFDSNFNDFKKPVERPRLTTTRPTILPANATGDNIETPTNREQSSDSEIVNFPHEYNHKNGNIKKRTDNKSLPLNYPKPILKTSYTVPRASEVDNALEPSQGAESTQTSLRESSKRNHQSSSINGSLPQFSTSHDVTNKEPKSISASQHSSDIDGKDNLEGKDEDFKVNVVRHGSITESPTSEDEDQYGEIMSEYVSLEYSSQAASIFFGNEESPTFSRPRRVRLRDDDSEDKKENGEAEC